VALGGLGNIGAQQAVPPRQVEAIVRIGLARVDGMVDAVHVGSNNKQAQHAVHGPGQVDIGVIEQGRRVQKHLEQQDRDGRGASVCCVEVKARLVD